MPNPYHQATKRLHRVIANHLAIRAWVAGADCVILGRTVIGSLLQIEKIEQARVDDILLDMQPWFPHGCYLLDADKSYFRLRSLYLSRIDVAQRIDEGKTDDQNIQELNDAGVKTLLIETPKTGEYSEQSILHNSVLWATGLGCPGTGEV